MQEHKFRWRLNDILLFMFSFLFLPRTFSIQQFEIIERMRTDEKKMNVPMRWEVNNYPILRYTELTLSKSASPAAI